MTVAELKIEHKKLPATLIASTHLNAKSRPELRAPLANLTERLPDGAITGPAFCIFQFITSYTEGFEAEVGFPVARTVETDGIQARTRPEMQVLSLVHTGPVESLRDSLLKLYGFASEHGIISDEFRQEVYLDSDNPEGEQIELHFVIHDWNGLLDRNLVRVLGEQSRQKVMAGSEALTMESSIPERFEWTKAMVQQLDTMADDDQRYEILSRCAHVFPKGQIAKLGVVFEETRAQTGDPWQAVDAVIEFMIADPGWGVRPVRRGVTVYAAKNPRDPQAHAQAQTDAERKRATCFCPLIRDHLDGGMSDTFCCCSAGWERQQWEGATGRPVRVDVVKSLLKGDDLCEFAIHLPADL